MGLRQPTDLRAWQRWQASQQPLQRRLRRGLSRRGGLPAEEIYLARGGSRPRLLVALDHQSPTSKAALLSVLNHVDLEQTAVLATTPVVHALPPWEWKATTASLDGVLANNLPDVVIILSLGHYLPLSGKLLSLLRQDGRHTQFVTVQHGPLTPFVPPLAPRSMVLSWSESDATYWSSGRDDVDSLVVGSQILWEASRSPTSQPDPASTPVFLGQLHGAELDFQSKSESSEYFCLNFDADYRPHPSEVDRRSRRAHRRWKAMGIRFADPGPLVDLHRPIVSAFSTGLLEAAAAGMPSWSFHIDPPEWLEEFWDRYAIGRWGQDPPTQANISSSEPAKAIARVLERWLD